MDKFASIYTPAVFAVALAVAIIPPLAFGQPWLEWVYKALVMLVIACPCALVISTPVTVVSGLAAAARRGILVKGGLYRTGPAPEVGGPDKTGTLTHGRPALTDVIAQGAMTKDEALRLAASIDALRASVAAAIVAGHGNAPLSAVERFEALPDAASRET